VVLFAAWDHEEFYLKTKLKCPQCRSEVIWEGNPHRPFCSERCRLLDLGRWADEEYRIPLPEDAVENDDGIQTEPDKDRKLS